MSERTQFTLGIVAHNRFGVLSQVAGLFAKRGYNIDSLSLGETDDRAWSRMTVVCTGDEYMREQVVRQLEKLHDVRRVWCFTKERSVTSEHLLIKVAVTPEKPDSKAVLSSLIIAHSGKVLDFGDNFLTAEITAPSAQIDAVINTARGYGILEMCRSGMLAVWRGVSG